MGRKTRGRKDRTTSRDKTKPRNLSLVERFAKKGVSGKVITIVISLVIALAALIVLWTFFMKTSPLIGDAVENIISGLKEKICENAWVFSGVCEWALGA